MAGQTVGGLFKDAARGEVALRELKSARFATAQISELADQDDPAPKRLTNPIAEFFNDHTTSGSDFENSLTDLGMSAHDAKFFEDGVARGGALVTVKTDDRVSEALTILRRNGADLGSLGRDGAAMQGSGSVAAGKDSGETDSLQLRAERLAVEKTRVASGAVRIGKRVVSEKQSIDVPVSHDELVIERHKIADGAIGGTIGGNETISVPLSRDEVRVKKETFATEEIDIGKRAVAGKENVTETVRHEELVIDGDEGMKRSDSRI